MRFLRAMVLGLGVAAGFGLLASPPACAAERDIVVTEGADYFGRDFDVLRDVELDACKAACIGRNECQAFTYNVQARWCFLKSDVGELRAVEGAISGRISVAAEIRPDVEAERVSELGFLPQSYLDEARRLKGKVAEERPLASGSLQDVLAAADRAKAAGDNSATLDQLRLALALAPERFDLWMRLAGAALLADSEDWQVKQRIEETRTAAALNAYLRAVSEAERADALELLARALQTRQAWKPAIRAFRASLALSPEPAAQAALDGLVAEHGFRIVEHRIDSDAANPRICLVFSEALATGRDDLVDFVSVNGADRLPVEADGSQVCIDGVEHGGRYGVTVRAGLPAADGEVLGKSATLDLYVRDRAPSVRFESHAYVLPAGGEASLPVVTVNTDRIEAELVRVGDRQLARAIGDGQFLRQFSQYEIDEIKARTGVAVWQGSVEVRGETNREATTAIPVGELVKTLEPGAYVLTARAANAAETWMPDATQWFIVTDLGLTTFSGHDGLHVFVRALSSAAPRAGVNLRLVALNNEVLGRAETDANGYARLAPGLMRGTGGMAPALLAAETEAGDYSFLDLTKQAVDLTDRGVEGRPPPAPLDVFLRTERGIYRVGETVHATGLVRDGTAHAVENLRLTAIVTRPDGVEHERMQLDDQGLGSVHAAIALPENGMRGAWRIGLHADPKASPLAETTFLVEDFQPERLDFDLTASSAALDLAAPPAISVDARFLYGAPAGNLSVEGETILAPAEGVPAYPGYRFGLADETIEPMREPFDSVLTDAAGEAEVTLKLPAVDPASRPLQATVSVRVIDTSGRPVERSLTLPVNVEAPRIGVKPLFDGAVDENGTAAFDVIAIDSEGRRIAAEALDWTLNQVETRFQWYSVDGRWDYETVTSKRRVAGGTVSVPSSDPARIAAQVGWGGYELEVRDPKNIALPASVSFEAGWYVAPQALETPDILKVSLDKPRYRIGETAMVHIEPRFPGEAQLLVLDGRLVATKAVTVPAEGATIPIEVTRDWGPGAYVTAVLYRPMDLSAKRMPGRAIGLQWAGVEPGDRLLKVTLDVADEMRPRGPMTVNVAIPNLAAGQQAYVTLAAVDLGILNLTGYQTPKPEEWYFGQRRLGVEIRDVYNSLIDRMQGVRGIVRSGGEAPLAGFEGPPPTEKLVALHSGIVRVGADGRATITFVVPDFNGTLRLMAMAWTKDGVGHAETDVLVRDPVVMAASSPAFLAPGDRSRLAVDLAHTFGPAGEVALSVSALEGHVAVDGTDLRNLTLAENERRQVLVPLTATSPGDDVIRLALTLPDGEVLEKRLALSVRVNEPRTLRRSFVALAPGASMTLDPDAFAEFRPGTGTATLSATGAGRLDVVGILRALDRYPYGCTEQIASRAMPLVYLDAVTLAAGLAGDPDIRRRVEEAIAGVLANQASNGAFGLWSPGSDDLWLDAYVTDFLTRAKAAGYVVPEAGFSLALGNLRNRVAYAPDFETGGEDIAYALYVLARNGRAAIGDLRYYAETRLDTFATPLAKAQVGAALALYGDRLRADAAFRRAVSSIGEGVENRGWRMDYGSRLRDMAAILTLASETKTEGVDRKRLADRIQAERAAATQTSTQEDAWSLLAAHALIEGSAAPDLAVNGAPVDGPLYARFDMTGADITPVVIENRGAAPVDVAVTLSGVPLAPEPAGGHFYRIERAYFTLEGEPVDLARVPQGERFVAVLTVTADEYLPARLVVDDPLPAGFEIDNPSVLRGGDVAALEWLDLAATPAHVEFRADRFVAAVNWGVSDATRFQFAYVVRAVSPGAFEHPAAIVEDMYRPERRARTESGTVEVVGPLR